MHEEEEAEIPAWDRIALLASEASTSAPRETPAPASLYAAYVFCGAGMLVPFNRCPQKNKHNLNPVN